MSGAPLQHETWENLVKLTQDISETRLTSILNDILKVGSFRNLTQEQALEIERTLRGIPNLKKLLWEGIVKAIEDEQSQQSSRGIRLLSKVEPTAVAEIIVQVQLDALATQLVSTGVNLDLFRDSPQIEV